MSHKVPKSMSKNLPRKSSGMESFLPSTVVTLKAGAGSPASSVTRGVSRRTPMSIGSSLRPLRTGGTVKARMMCPNQTSMLKSLSEGRVE